MTRLILIFSTATIFLGVFFLSCSSKSKYESMVSEGLASGERYDSIFLGIHLGMSDSAFFTHCWNLNKQKKIYQGGGNMSVMYKLEEGLSSPGAMEFYPEFIEGKIAKMPVLIYYEGWAPWNKEMATEKLQQESLLLFKKWYGDDFMEIEHPVMGFAYIKVDGNRQITLYKNDEKSVIAFFTDLSVSKGTDNDSLLNNL